MNFVNAELTKLAVNTFVTTKISYANMLADICERLPGSNVDVVTSAVGLDSRIGAKYLKAATGYGGPCFPRDNRALGYLGRNVGSRAILAEATDELNRQHSVRLAELVLAKLPLHGRVGILGLAYKPDTKVVEESAGIGLARYLSEHGVQVIAYDPLAMDNAQAVLDHSVSFASSVAECVRQVDAVVVTTPLHEFRDLSAYVNGKLTVIDCWRFLDSTLPEGNVDYVRIGVGEKVHWKKHSGVG